MLQIESRSTIDLEVVSTRAQQLPSVATWPSHEKPKWQQGDAAKGTGIHIEELLPKVRDRLVTVGTDAPLTHAADLLFEPSCRTVVVCDSAGIMKGVITRTDIIRQIRHCQGCACTTRCLMIMTTQVISCRPDDRLDDIWAVMREKELHSIPVVDTKLRPLGLLSARDALEALLATAQHEETLLRDYIMG